MLTQSLHQSKIAKIIIFGVGLPIVLLAFVAGLYAHRNTIWIGEVTWKRNWKQNNETTIYFQGNRILTEKGIQIFGSGEYLIGTYITKEDNIIFFSYDVVDCQLKYYRNLWELENQVKSPVDSRKFATFEDVKGQHADKVKNDLLKQWTLEVNRRSKKG